MAVFFTSDLHLGHRFVAGLRGFTDPAEHDAAIIVNGPTAHDRLTNYLRSTGWKTPPVGGGTAGHLWSHPDTGLGLPVPTVLVDGGLDWEQILRRLADVENVAPAVIASRLSGAS